MARKPYVRFDRSRRERNVPITDDNARAMLDRLNVGQPVTVAAGFLYGEFTVQHAGAMVVPRPPRHGDHAPRSAAIRGAALVDAAGTVHVVGNRWDPTSGRVDHAGSFHVSGTARHWGDSYEAVTD